MSIHSLISVIAGGFNTPGLGWVDYTVFIVAIAAAWQVWQARRSRSSTLPADRSLVRDRDAGGRNTPPRWAALALALLRDPEQAEEVLGDFDERYKYMLNRFSRRAADIWYVGAVVRSLVALLPSMLSKALGLSDVLRKLSGGR